MSEPSKRRQARELTLQILFQKEFVKGIAIADHLAYFREHLSLPEEAWAYAEKLLYGIEKYHDEIDKIIGDKSPNWKITRMAPVDLSLLRMGTFEIVYAASEVPPKVAIDEAIEIAKRYGGTESPHFINGILDEIRKGIH